MFISSKRNITKSWIIIIAIIGIFLVSAVYLIYDHTLELKQQNESIIITTYDESIRVKGDVTLVKAQLYSNGSLNNRSGVNITFELDNNTIAGLSNSNFSTTDENGTAIASIISNKTPGRVKVTASYKSNDVKVSNYTYLNVYRPVSICGLVLDKNGVGVPDAVTTLWRYAYNNSSMKFENYNVSKVLDGSIHYTSDGWSTPAGLYEYVDVPAGTYNITVEKDGHTAYSIVDVDYGTKTCMIDMPDYEYAGETYFGLTNPPASKGTIWGLVDLFTGNVSLLDINVILWHTKYSPVNDTWENAGIVDIPNNPQVLHNNIGFNNTPGMYKFDNVPAGIYKITASEHVVSEERYNASEYITSDHKYYAIVKLDDNMSTNFIVLLTPLYQ